MKQVVANIVGVREQTLEIHVMSRPLRGCYSTSSAVLTVARTTARTTALGTCTAIPPFGARCSGLHNKKKHRPDGRFFANFFISLQKQKGQISNQQTSNQTTMNHILFAWYHLWNDCSRQPDMQVPTIYI